MDYPFEQLSPERFQHFAQALLVREFPNVQSFPVGQPDGGRDAVMYTPGSFDRGFVMFQVKFVRNPDSITDTQKWLTKIISEELPKITVQRIQGATSYVLITNMPGTAHPVSGKIDRLHQGLNTALPVPAQIWWRDDLNRRLDNAWDLKWVYPELMTGPDLIRSIVERGISEDQVRRTNALRAYLRDQYERDQEVKFKQVELQNHLLDLFIDVPIVPLEVESGESISNRHARVVHRFISHSHQQMITHGNELHEPNLPVFDFIYESDERVSLGAAEFFLANLVQRTIPRLVLEGAPGQGKSTISQYLCQIHRMRIMQRNDILAQVPDIHKTAAVRFPFKIDLRDFAAWLGRANPFSAELPASVPEGWQRSLEAFLAAHIQHYSGGTAFSVADFLAVARVSAILLVFDGLDEVAEIPRRKTVVEEIVNGVNRLEGNAASLQVIITSRPAAFTNSPGLPQSIYPYFQLDSVTPQLIDEYTEKWLKARGLSVREGAEVRKTLKQRLTEPHIRDLARNPMQLAILLSLVHTRGSSLPDKRTALYDSYVELFFNREAEKSEIVRSHRDLLVNIHRYLGWRLHAEAESGKGNGIVAEDRLHGILRSYLENEGHDPALSGVLFTGMVERVVALVSRVQGTYEFEVQPLREYFAGRFLYETAPYSPTGNEKRGTKPDRFDALARNFYWTNVTRFYAGCYSKGELASLIDRIEDLISDPIFKFTSHARLLAATFLSDWVFSQHPKSVTEVVDLILDGIGLRFLATSSPRKGGTTNPLVFPEQSGRREMATLCAETLRNNPPLEFARDLVELFKANTTPTKADEFWVSEASQSHDSYEFWWEVGLRLGVLERLPDTVISSIAPSGFADPLVVKNLLFSQRFDIFSVNSDIYNMAIKCILSLEIVSEHSPKVRSALEVLGVIINPQRYTGQTFAYYHLGVESTWRDYNIPPLVFDISSKQEWPDEWPTAFPAEEQIKEIFRVATLESRRSVPEWDSDLTPWNNIVEAIRSTFGDVWASYNLANVAAGIRSREETGAGARDLFDQSTSLCQRARFARLRMNNSRWWRDTFLQATSAEHRMFAVLVLLTWASGSTIKSLLQDVHDALETLNSADFRRLYRSLETAIRIKDVKRLGTPVHNQPWGDVSLRMAVLLAQRSSDSVLLNLLLQHLDSRSSDSTINYFLQLAAAKLLAGGLIEWEQVLPLVSYTYRAGVVLERFSPARFGRSSISARMSVETAQRVAEDAQSYPSFAVATAEAVMTELAASQVIPISVIASRDEWFTD